MSKHDTTEAPEAGTEAGTGAEAPAGTDAGTDAGTGADDKGTTPKADDAEPTTTPADAFRAAFAAAIDTRDAATGDVPAAALDGLKVAYRKVPAASRGGIVAALNAEASTDATVKRDEKDTRSLPDVGALLAIAKISAAIAEAAEAGAVRESVKRDPKDIAAERYALLTVARDVVTADFDDDARAAIESAAAKIAAEPVPTEALTSKLARIVRALGTGSKSAGSGTRAEAGSIGAGIVAAFQATDEGGAFLLPIGEPVTYGAIARIAEKSAGAVQNALPGGSSDAKLEGIVTHDRTASGAPKSVVVADRDALTMPAATDDAATDDAADDDAESK